MKNIVSIEECRVDAQMQRQISLRDFGNLFCANKQKRDAIKTIISIPSLQIEHGDMVGVIGGNGWGKSSLLKLLAGIYYPTKAETYQVSENRVLLDNLGTLTVPEFSGRANINYACKILNLPPGSEEDIASFTRLGADLDEPMNIYSAGMQLRVLFGIMTAIPSELLLIDEIFGVGDASFQHFAAERLEALTSQSGAMLLASHSMELVKNVCNKLVAFTPDGKLLNFDDPQSGVDFYEDFYKNELNTVQG
jgi:ABC-type polysaccharide/polyol phosphate transport system ATPase subunit